ncbi:hypothetical protein HaLaN_04193, partial [Haematococcus lacustris]
MAALASAFSVEGGVYKVDNATLSIFCKEESVTA